MTKHEETAWEILPCEWMTEHNSYECKDGESKCMMCLARPAVAAALAQAEAKGVKIGLAWASANAEMRRSNERIMLDDARKRNERERAEMHGDRIRVLTEQIDDIDAEIAKAGGGQ